MIRLLIASLMLYCIPKISHAVAYQLPGMKLCNQKSCPIGLDDDGYLVDVSSKKIIFSTPMQQTMFNYYALFRSRGNFIIEESSTSSSKNWAAVMFTYIGGKVHAVRYISLSRSVDAPVEGNNPDAMR